MEKLTILLPEGDPLELELSDTEWWALQFLMRRDGVSLQEIVSLAISEFIGVQPIILQGKGRPS